MARIARLTRSRMIPAVTAALALVLSSCAAGQIAQTAQQVPAIDGASANVGAVGIRNVLLATTEATGYQVGADAPLTLWISNTAMSSDSLTSVSSPAATSGKIAGTAEVQGQSLVQISDTSEVTITLTKLKDALPYGHSIPVTFTFAKAGSVTVNVPIQTPVERSTEARETVDILPAEPTNIWFGPEGGSAEPSP